MKTVTLKNGTEITIRAGQYLAPDGWRGDGERIKDCTDWDRAEFRLPSANYFNIESAINLEVSGRQVRWINNVRDQAVRVKIEWLRDEEPSDFSYGWLYLEFEDFRETIQC